jgi:glycosyltransferase involved in cell wall biosynthesis
MFNAFDHNYFATQFHITLFLENLLGDVRDSRQAYLPTKKIVRTGWPMEYMNDTLTAYKAMPKRDLIVFPHRIAPEKQVEIFRDLKAQLPQYEFVVCQDQQLTKNEYHNLLGEAKIVFSANLQETLGISCYEGALVDAVPMVPDRLSYTEMYLDEFKYPSRWTESFDAYVTHREHLCSQIVHYMENYKSLVPIVRAQADALTEEFFTCNNFLNNLS